MSRTQPAVEIYDSTLRDGAQAEGIAYSLEAKRLIARRLDALGVHYIEGGWPNPTSPKDLAFFAAVAFFFSWRARKWLQPAENLHFLWTTYTGPRFSADLTARLWEGATVTNVALQAAYYMGFQEVILIGVDHNFVTQGKPNTTITSTGDDPNHFHPGYFGQGFRWQLPDLETSEIAYHMAKEAYQKDGREILDATVGGKLTVFPKVDYDKTLA